VTGISENDAALAVLMCSTGCVPTTQVLSSSRHRFGRERGQIHSVKDIS
jgi:hypothetical protein